MNDKFARETASQAHRRITELSRKIVQLEKTIARRSTFQNRCALCGNPCGTKTRYCHAHQWAEGLD